MMSPQPSAISFQPAVAPASRRCMDGRDRARPLPGGVGVSPANVGRRGPTLQDGRRGGRPLRAFTLIELLIVITVIGILIAVIGLVGVKVAHQQKVTLTETIMRNVKLAIDQFKDNNPLANIYDRKGLETFGPYPPYQLANYGVGVAGVLEPAHPLVPPPPFPLYLSQRVARDLSGFGGNGLVYENWVRVAIGSPDPSEANDDIRALYAYLKVYSPDTLAQVPRSAMKAIPAPGKVDRVYPRGFADPNAVEDVLGIYDAWGVPLDYFLYVKLEYTLLPSGPGWRVAERIPALRSFGISREEYDQEIKKQDELDPERWIFSDPFPSPAAAALSGASRQSGTLPATGSAAVAGWARAVGAGDLDGSLPANSPGLFGYVP
jgi:prepilin-type N-terminal cleavage/methylation domain-containing protein